MPPGSPVPSWNLLIDVQELWSFPFMLNAFRAGTIVAILAGAIGWFMVLRKQSFAGHTLAMVSFPGAAGATLIGVSTAYGYFGFCIAAALVIAARPRSGSGGHAEESAVTGTVQAFALASGFLFIALYKGFLDGVTALLFGSLLGVTDSQVLILLVVAVLALGTLAVIGRPLLFASIDPDVAAARGVPTRVLSAVFLVLLGAAVAEASQLTGALLVFALLVMPAATAQVLSPRPLFSLVLSIVIGIVVTWFGLGVAFYSQYPIGFFVTTFAFVLYVLANAVKLGIPKLRTAWSPA